MFQGANSVLSRNMIGAFDIAKVMLAKDIS